MRASSASGRSWNCCALPARSLRYFSESGGVHSGAVSTLPCDRQPLDLTGVYSLKESLVKESFGKRRRIRVQLIGWLSLDNPARAGSRKQGEKYAFSDEDTFIESAEL